LRVNYFDMDISLLLTGAMIFLKPYLTKVAETFADKATETVGERLVDKSFWKSVKKLFINEDQEIIENIENKTTAAPADVEVIEQKISTELTSNPKFADELKSALNITPINEFLITEKLKSIRRLQDDISKLTIQLERAGIAVLGDYQNQIDIKAELMNDQMEDVRKLMKL
jgi:hypothetical protein